jgi:hypothetical protein
MNHAVFSTGRIVRNNRGVHSIRIAHNTRVIRNVRKIHSVRNIHKARNASSIRTGMTGRRSRGTGRNVQVAGAGGGESFPAARSTSVAPLSRRQKSFLLVC